MRRVVGAFLIIVLLIAYRYSHDPLGDSPVRSFSGGDTVSDRVVSAPRRSAHAAAVPEAYRLDPLRYLSRAPIDSLCMLPGIGPVLAERLASARTGKSLFTQWQDLLVVKGIGPKTVEKLRRAADE